MDTIKLSHVNTPLASTWNKLNINDIAFELPNVSSEGAVYGRLPRLFSKLESALGDEALNWIESAAQDGRYIEVKPNDCGEDALVIQIGDNEVSDLGILVREGARANVVLITNVEQGSSAAMTRIIAEKGAELIISEFVCAQEAAQHLEGLSIQADDDVNIEVKQYLLGGKRVASGLLVDLAGARSVLNLSCRYVASGEDVLDITHSVRARGKDTRENLLAQGYLADKATKTLRETIDLVHGAKGSEGNEAETVMLVGDEITNRTLPTILCDEDDVQGNHGATIGSIGEEQLNYLKCRGLDKNAAQALFLQAIFADALICANDEHAREAVRAQAKRLLPDELADDLLVSFD